MDAVEHYREAERLLTVCAGDQRGSELDAACTAAAQVHATLALAGATALQGMSESGLPQRDCEAWVKAAGMSAIKALIDHEPATLAAKLQYVTIFHVLRP